MILKNVLYYNDRFELDRSDISVENGLIGKLGHVDEDGMVLEGLTVLPGLIDIHIHGCCGQDFGSCDERGLQTASEWLCSRGVTSFCPTLASIPLDQLQKASQTVKCASDSVRGAGIAGLHLEGRYLSPLRGGAQDVDQFVLPDSVEFLKLNESVDGLFRIVTAAPELENGLQFIRAVKDQCKVAAAHTDADYDTAVSAFAAGATHVTHLFNAMSGLHHRKPGTAGAVLDCADTYDLTAELICDGFHIHPAVLRLAFSVLGEDRSVIVSDAMAGAGMPDGTYSFGESVVEIRNGLCMLPNGTICASTANLLDEVRYAAENGVPVKQAVKSATINPARVIGADSVLGSVREGKQADLIAVDAAFNVKIVMIRGKIVINNL